jgi:sec-independent protein translocase protein TatC
MNQPFIQHLHELRRRLTWSVLVLGAGAGLGYWQRDAILDWLQAPLHGTLYYSKIMGAFEFLMQACLLVGVLFAIPVLVYNLVAFVRPALPRPVSRRSIAGVVAASCALTVAGVLFAYYVSLPTVLHFLGTIDVSHLHPLIAADSYLSFVINYLAVFAAIFQLPLVLTFIDRITPLPPAKLKGLRRWIFIGAFAAGLILPVAPDPISQAMLALPVVVLYEISLWLVVWQHRSRRRRAARQAPVYPAQLSKPPAPAPRPRPQARPRPVDPAFAPVHPAFTRAPRVIDLREHKQFDPTPSRLVPYSQEVRRRHA